MWNIIKRTLFGIARTETLLRFSKVMVIPTSLYESEWDKSWYSRLWHHVTHNRRDNEGVKMKFLRAIARREELNMFNVTSKVKWNEMIWRKLEKEDMLEDFYQ
jgi:hypothetical protein